jgi:hypothetical protein
MSVVTAFVREHRVSLVLALLVIVVVGPIVAPDSSQPASRLALTAALVEHRSVDIGPYKHVLGVDFSTYQGHLRSDKAPGQPLFAIPAYLVARLAGAPSATHRQVHRNLELWIVAFWSAMLPLALLIALLYEECCRFARRGAALAVTLLLVFCTMLLPFGSVVFAHVLAAAFGFGAWLLVNRAPIEPRRAAIAGLLAGCAVLMEYEAAIIVAALAGYLLVRDRRRLAQFAAGGVAPVVVLAWYQWRAFGAPWHTPAAYYNLKSGYKIPSPYDLWWMFGGGRGLWIGAPIAIVGIGAAIWLVSTGRGSLRDYAFVALAVIVPYIVLCAGWSGTPLLVDPGPRYLIPALPFLAVPLAAMWDRVRVVAIVASAFGALVAAGATWLLLVVNRHYFILDVYRGYLNNRWFNPTLWSMGLGAVGTFLYLASIAAVAVLLAHVYEQQADGGASATRSGAFENQSQPAA